MEQAFHIGIVSGRGIIMDKLDPIEIDPETFLRSHCSLPALPSVITKVQSIIHSDKADIGELEKDISRDPGLVAQIIKIVNSAYFGLPREVSDVKFALAFLGLNEIYRIVLSVSVIDTLSIGEKRALDKFWFHSYFTAICTKNVAKKFNPLLSFDDLWSAAILHDIGKLVYLKFFPDHYRALTKFSKKEGILFSKAETHFSLPSSSYFGALLCDRWNLPGKIKNACNFHTIHDLINSHENTSQEFIKIISLGNLLAVLSTDNLNNDSKNDIIAAIRGTFNLNEQEFLTLMGEIYELKMEAEKLN